ncbi:MAG TPA: YdcF family protein [Candidatus Angelobacter sp.]|nr:YdcF family protein [Candidatus Angelobacter sp.]
MIRNQARHLHDRGRARTWLVASLLFLCLGLLCFLRIGNWLVREDPLRPSSAIVVLSGAMPERALEATEIYHAGLAPEVWITQPAEPKQAMTTLGIPFDGEEEYSRRVLMKHGVPERAIRILQPPIVNTADEMNTIAATLESVHGLSVIVVTSKAHTRRVHGLWNRLEAKRGQIIVRAARTDSFDPSHWWRTTHDALDVVRELLGLLNVWAGLPLKPTR